MATYRSNAITDKENTSTPPIRWKKNIWVKQPLQEMVFLGDKRSARTLGAVMEEKHMLAIDKLQSKNIHGCVKARLTGLSDHDEEVSLQSCHIHQKKDKK